MMAASVAHVAVEVVHHDRGHWCNTCQLPAGIRAWVVVYCSHAMRMEIRVWCDDCDGQDVTVDATAA